jgi:phosphohistidine phosphatase
MPRVYRQASVIPYRIHEERVEIALVTSQGGKRWVVPKGSLDDGEDAMDAAIRETEGRRG